MAAPNMTDPNQQHQTSLIQKWQAKYDRSDQKVPNYRYQLAGPNKYRLKQASPNGRSKQYMAGSNIELNVTTFIVTPTFFGVKQTMIYFENESTQDTNLC